VIVGSLDYYDKNADAFYERTIKADVSETRKKFLFYVKSPAKILDAGCGVGRDAKYFADIGYDVTAFDGSLEMAKRASKELGKSVAELLHMDKSRGVLTART
jgi:SAM-dependent methyltransferase